MKKNYFPLFFVFIWLFVSNIDVVHGQDMSVFDIARNGTLVQMKSLQKKNPDIINKKNEAGYSLLTLACYHENYDVAEYLIQHVKDINAGSNYGTPLMAATVKGNLKIVNLLLAKKANTNTADPNGTTALHYAIIFKFDSIAELLIKANANANLKDNRGKTALDYAKIIGNKKIINLLTTR